MIIATDVETYKQYDGTQESYEYIKEHQPEGKEIKKEELKKGLYYPVLNSQDYTLGVVITEKKTKRHFYTPKEHLQYILQLHEQQKNKKQKLYIYGHNHKYDFLAYAREIIFNNKIRIIRETPLYAIYDNTTYFLDTMSYYPKQKLADIATEQGQAKLTMPTEITTPEQLLEYCTKDTQITIDAILRVKENLAKIGFKPKKLQTAGQTAMSTWQSHIRRQGIDKKIMKQGVIYKSPNTRKIRLALRGARCQAFRKGIYTATILDINRMYAWAMQNIKFPDLRKPIEIKQPTLEDWKYIKQLIGVIECTIEVDTQELPYLIAWTRLKGRKDPANTFPAKATIRGHWTIDEIDYTLKIQGYTLKEIHWAECYKPLGINPFYDYVQKVHQMGQDHPELDKTSKMLLTNLFGKFSQEAEDKDETIIYRDEIEKYMKQGWKVEAYIEDRVIMTKYKGKYIAPYSNPLISALITSKARQYHYEQLTKIPREDLLYCDTDSVIFKGDHKHKYEIQKGKIGAMKIERENKKITIKGRKNYQIEDEIKISGVPKRDMKQDTMEQKEIRIRRQIGIAEAKAEGTTQRIGQFKTITFNLEGIDIDSIQIPQNIDEREAYAER